MQNAQSIDQTEDQETTIAQDLAAELNAYDGDNHWQDVVESYAYSVKKTEELDGSNRSDVVAFPNGAIVRFSESTKQWYVETEGE